MIKKLCLVFLLIGFHCEISAMEPTSQLEPTIKTLTFGNHKLEICDRTGKFLVFQRFGPLKGDQRILFDYKLDGDYPIRFEDGVFNELYIQKLTPLLHFSNIVKFIIDPIENESIIQITALDEQGKKEIFYHCPKNKEFYTYFTRSDFYKRHFRIEKFRYHLIPHIPNSTLFSKKMVQIFLQDSFYPFMEKDLKYDDHDKIRHGDLKVFYNRHGIILNWDAHKLDYFRTPKDIYYPFQRGTCLYMNPTDYKITQKAYEFRLYINYRLRLFHVRCKKTLSALSLIFTIDRCFLNGEPATIMNRDEILELWGNCSSFLS